MDKKVLKEALTNLTVGQEIEVNFRSDRASLNGRYRVLESKTDRGKMGSRKAVLESVSTSEKVELHTKTNTEVLNLVVDGVMFGSTEEVNEPRVFTRDQVRGKELRTLFKTFVKGQQVRVTSEAEPTFNGVFTVVDNRPSRGKFGQQILTLQSGDGSATFEVWSYKHSTALTNIELVI